MAQSGTAGGRIAPGVGSNLIGAHAHDRNQDATLYVGNLDPQVRYKSVCFVCVCCDWCRIYGTAATAAAAAGLLPLLLPLLSCCTPRSPRP